jgi:ADP-ribosylglycohydrolase
MPGWAGLKELTKEEITQRREEGCDVTGFPERWEKAETEAQFMEIYNGLQELRVQSDFAYAEPSHLAGIRACRPGESKRWKVATNAKLLDRMHGAWLGRIAGCMLGKAVEGWSWDKIKTYLEFMGEYPLQDYFPLQGEKLPKGFERGVKGAARGTFKYALSDDDTNYTVIGLKIMEVMGVDFTTKQVGEMWLRNLPYRSVCTAERQAYVNLVNELHIDRVPMVLNPYREWIGAQIRADFWGYAAPGWPEKAAEFAYRDAALSHIKNGIYGEMFCAAAISAALATDDVNEIIQAALNEIPANSRLAETVDDCLKWRKSCKTWESAFAKMLKTYYGKYNWVHTNNNLAIVLIGLLYGWPDYEKTICISVMQGMDTDCNGATAGSIIGAALGAKALPQKWMKPLNGKLETTVIGFPMPEIKDLAERTMKQAEKVLV